MSDLYICRVTYICISIYTFKENEVRRHQLLKSQAFLNAADPFQMHKNPRRADWSAPRIRFYSSLTLLTLPSSQGWIIPDKVLEQLVLVSTLIFQSTWFIYLNIAVSTKAKFRETYVSHFSLHLIPHCCLLKLCSLIWGSQMEVGAVCITGQHSDRC